MWRPRSFSHLIRQGIGIGFLAAPIGVAAADAPRNPSKTQADWYHDGQRRVLIVPSPDTLNVVLAPGFSDSVPLIIFRHAIDRHGRHVLVRPPDVAAARSEYAALEEVEAVQSVYYRSAEARTVHDAAERLTPNGRIAVSAIVPGEIDAILRDFDLTRVRDVVYSSEMVIALVANGDEPLLAAQRLYQSGRVASAVPQFARLTTLRDVPNDPHFVDQWHLRNTGQGGGVPGADLNVVPAWDLASGVSSVVAIVDNGVDLDHPDLAGNIDHRVSIDINDGDGDPRPYCGDEHGTSVAGISGAVTDNALGVSGVAPDAKIGAIRLTAEAFSDEDTADALVHRLDIVDIYNNSWGPRDDGSTIDGPGVLTTAALDFGARYGRQGRGAIYIWAGGNGGQNGDNANFDGFVNSRYTIGVAASNNLGTVSSYSEPGACILVNAPSSGGLLSIATTDNAGGCGLVPGDYNFDAGGTSAAAPMVAGVVALMLDVNPELTWRDVQSILIFSATQNDPDDPGWTLNGAGLPIHPRLGFGRVDAEVAIQLAGIWSGVFPETLPVLSLGISSTSSAAVPDDDPTGVVFVTETPDRFVAAHVEVTVDITHPRRGDLEIVLTSPRGTESILASPRPIDLGQDLNWTFMTVRNWNEPTEGTWTLAVRDRRSGVEGTINSWSLVIYGRHLDLPRGDLNADGVFNSFDITEFFFAILDPAGYAAQYPGMISDYLGDFDDDGLLTAFDIPGFADMLFR